jgi:transposase
MPLAIKIEVRESISELRSLMRKSISMISTRLNMLIQIKKHDGRISRRKLALITGVSAGSIQTWRKIYLHGGLDALIRHDRNGSASKIFGACEREFLEHTLSNPENGIQGYVELQKLMSGHFGRKFAYVTLVEYCKRNFGTKIKVARKSHIKKDEKAVSDFKKTLSIRSQQPLKR